MLVEHDGDSTCNLGSGVPGSRPFAAPELIQEDIFDERCLVFSLARILWCVAAASNPRPRGHYDSYFEQYELDLDALEEADATPTERALLAEAPWPDPDERLPDLDTFRTRIDELP
jgi:hypothetical protein